MNNYIEENYLKAIYKLTNKNPSGGYTNDISIELNVKAATVSEALKKLSDKQLINYTKYKAVTLTQKGTDIAIKAIRRHRLWEVFLVKKLGFRWDEIHPMAEELEHINFDELVERLSNFLENPEFDPHGDPIPDKEGKFKPTQFVKLSNVGKGETVTLTGIENDSVAFLQHLNKLGFELGTRLNILDIVEFDNSILVKVDDTDEFYLSEEVANNILCRG